jgi:hypothetical protein
VVFFPANSTIFSLSTDTAQVPSLDKCDKTTSSIVARYVQPRFDPHDTHKQRRKPGQSMDIESPPTTNHAIEARAPLASPRKPHTACSPYPDRDSPLTSTCIQPRTGTGICPAALATAEHRDHATLPYWAYSLRLRSSPRQYTPHHPTFIIIRLS